MGVRLVPGSKARTNQIICKPYQRSSWGYNGYLRKPPHSVSPTCLIKITILAIQGILRLEVATTLGKYGGCAPAHQMMKQVHHGVADA